MGGGGAERLTFGGFVTLFPILRRARTDGWSCSRRRLRYSARTIQPLHTEPGKYVFTTNEGKPIEAKALASRSASRWIRPRGRS